MLYTPDFEINLMTDNENLLSKIDTSMIKHAVLADDGVKNILSQKTEVMLICRKVWEFDQYDHWTKKGIACYNVIVPYDTVIDNNISKEQITIVCSNLVKDCLLQWAEKKRKKPARPYGSEGLIELALSLVAGEFDPTDSFRLVYPPGNKQDN